MSTDIASIGLKADSSGVVNATNDLREFSSAAATADTSANKLGASTRKAGSSFTKLDAPLGKAGGKVISLQKGLDASAKSAGRLAVANKAAAGQTANLASQFNDIIVMAAAGQNPMQLALQQGTQISQVLTQMGGGVGSVRALGDAFVSMVNPISLATIGTIALGSALSNYIFSSGAEAKTFADNMDDLNDAVGRYNDMAKLAAESTSAMQDRFGSMSGVASQAAETLRVISKLDAATSLNAAIDDVTERFGGLSRSAQKFTSGGMVKEIEDTFFNLRDELKLTDEQAATTVLALERLSAADTMAEQVTAAEAFGSAMVAAFGALEDVPEELRDVTRETAQIALTAGEIVDEGAAAAAAYREQKEAAAEIVADLMQQAEMQRIIAVYGEDSAQASDARASAEREALAATLEAKNVTGELASEVFAAFDSTVSAAAATDDWAASMSGVRAEIGAIASALASMGGGVVQNAAKFAELNALKAGKSVAEASRARQKMMMDAEFDARAAGAGSWAERMLIQAERATAERGITLDDEIDAARSAARSTPRASARKANRSGGGGRARKGGGAQADEFQRSVESIRQQTAAMIQQADAIARASEAGADWERALAVIEEEQKLLNAAQKAGVEITNGTRDSIAQMAEGYVSAEEAMRKSREEAEKISDASDRGRDSLEGMFGSIIDGSMSAKEAVAQLLLEIAKAQMLKGIMGLPGMGGLSSAIGGLSLPAFENGGSHQGGLRLVGENGPEIEATGPSRIWTAAQTEKFLKPDSAAKQGNQTGNGTVVVQATHDPGIILKVVDSRINAKAPSIQRGAVEQTVRGSRKSKSFLGR